MDFNRCDFTFLKEEKWVVFPKLTRLKFYECSASTSKYTYDLFLKMAPNLKEFIFRYPYRWEFYTVELTEVVKSIRNYLQKCEKRIELLSLVCPNPKMNITPFLKLNLKNLRSLEIASDFCRHTLIETCRQIIKFHLVTLKIAYINIIEPGDTNQRYNGIPGEFITLFQNNLYLLRHFRLTNFIVDEESFDIIMNIPFLKILELKNCCISKTTRVEMTLNRNMRVSSI